MMQAEETPPATTTAVATKPRSLLANGRYLRLWLGQAVSYLGDFVFDTTLVVWIAADLARGQSWAPLAVSGALAAALIPTFLVGPFAGVFVDRADQKRLMLAMDLLRAALITLLIPLSGVVPLPFISGGRLATVPLLVTIYVVVFLAGVCSQFFNPARTAILPDVVPSAQLAQATGWGQAAYSGAVLIGPPLAAPLLFAFGPQWALLVNALSFVASFLMILSVRLPRRAAAGAGEAEAAAAGARRSFARDWMQGARFFFGSRVLVTIFVVGIFAGLIDGTFNSAGIFFAQQNLHIPAAYYGFLGSAYAGGTLAGSIGIGLLAERLGLTRVFATSLTVLGAGLVVFSRMTSFVPGLIAFFACGLVQAGVSLTIGPILLKVTPRDLLGRMLSLLNPVIVGMNLLAVALCGYLISVVLVGFRATLAGVTFGPLDTLYGVMGLLAIAAGLFAALNLRGVRLEPPAEVAAA